MPAYMVCLIVLNSGFYYIMLLKVCLPGGMVSDGADKSIVQTCLREMEEEIGIGHHATTVLGVLRCNWGEVSFITASFNFFVA